MIVDSNLIILSNTPPYPGLRRMLAGLNYSVSAISLLEVLGYPGITPTEERLFRNVFANVSIVAITDVIISQAIHLRKTRKMKLADSIVAATALESGQELYTHNTKDFTHIPGLIVHDPIAAGDPP